MSDVTAADRATAAKIGLHSPHCLGGDPCTCDATATIAEALAAERAKALAPLLALADELEAWPSSRCMRPHAAADRIRAAAGPDRTAGEETP